MTTPTQADPRRITYSREDRDYAAYYDGTLIGFFATFHQAEIALDDYALGPIGDGLTDEVPPALHARPADVADVLYACSCETDLAPTASPAALPGEPHAPAAALAAPDIGESLWGEFHDDPVAFLTLLGTFGDKARDAVNQAVAAYLECPVSEVVGIWGESRARAVRRGMLS